jgi:hypothetical protein
MAKDPFGSNKLIERAGGKIVIGQSGYLVWFGDGVNSNLSALLEVEELVDVLRRLRRAKEESSSHFDCVSVFSKLMSTLVKSSATLEHESKSLCSVASTSSWLHQYTNTDNLVTKNRIAIRLHQTQACWEEMEEESERSLIENLYAAADDNFNSPQSQAERRQAAAEAGEGSFGAISLFVPGVAVRGNAFNPVMSTSFESGIGTLANDRQTESGVNAHLSTNRQSAPTAPGVSAAPAKLRVAPTAQRGGAPPEQPSGCTALRVSEIANWTSNASADIGASPSARTPFRKWLEDSGLDDPANGLHAETLNKFHQLGCDTKVLKMMLPSSFVRANITPDQAALVCEALAANHDRQGSDDSADTKLFRQSLMRLGLDEATITYVFMTVEDLNTLRMLDAGHELLSRVAVEQREKLKPILAAAPRLEVVEEADAVGKCTACLRDPDSQLQTNPRRQDADIQERLAWEREVERRRVEAMSMREERCPVVETHRLRGAVHERVAGAYPRLYHSEAPELSRRASGAKLEEPRRALVERPHNQRGAKRLANIDSEHFPSVISVWLEAHGTSRVKSDRILEVCDAQLFDSPN